MPHYVANKPIPHGWALAYHTGDPVHLSALESQGGWVKAEDVDEVADDADGRPERTGSAADATYTDRQDEDATKATGKPATTKPAPAGGEK